MVVTATYNNGDMVPVTTYTCSPTEALTTSDSLITISYSSYQTGFDPATMLIRFKADVNGDGAVGVDDIRLIYSIIYGLVDNDTPEATALGVIDTVEYQSGNWYARILGGDEYSTAASRASYEGNAFISYSVSGGENCGSTALLSALRPIMM